MTNDSTYVILYREKIHLRWNGSWELSFWKFCKQESSLWNTKCIDTYQTNVISRLAKAHTLNACEKSILQCDRPPRLDLHQYQWWKGYSARTLAVALNIHLRFDGEKITWKIRSRETWPTLTSAMIKTSPKILFKPSDPIRTRDKSTRWLGILPPWLCQGQIT